MPDLSRIRGLVGVRLRPCLRRAEARLRDDAGLLVACSLLTAFGVLLRSHALGFPHKMTWDEDHFVVNARNLLHGLADNNDHPPLGKVLIALAIHLRGDSSTAWRIVPFIAGVLTIVLAWRLASKLFGDQRAGWIAAAFLAADGFFIAYSRSALLDGLLAMFMMAAALAIVSARTWGQVAAACALAGLALSIKFSGIVLVPAIVIATLVVGRAPRASVVCLALVPVVYYAQYALGLVLMGRSWGPSEVVDATRSLLEHHAKLTAGVHPMISSWHTWLIPTRPVTLRCEPVEGGARVLTTLGNPLLWWGASLSVVAALSLSAQRFTAWAAHRAGACGPPPAGRLLVRDRNGLPLLLGFWLLPVAPWFFSNRDSYIYHYLPAYGFALVLFAGWVFVAYRRAPLAMLVLVCVVGVVAAFYAPVWAQFPITREYPFTG